MFSWGGGRDIASILEAVLGLRQRRGFYQNFGVNGAQY